MARGSSDRRRRSRARADRDARSTDGVVDRSSRCGWICANDRWLEVRESTATTRAPADRDAIDGRTRDDVRRVLQDVHVGACARARAGATARAGDGARAARGRRRARGGDDRARDLDDEGGGRRATRARTGGLTRRERARAEFGGVRRGDRRGGARGGEGVELRIRSRVGEVRGRSDATRNDATRNDATRATRARRARARAMMRMGIDRGFRRRFARSSNKGKLWKDVEKRLELE